MKRNVIEHDVDARYTIGDDVSVCLPSGWKMAGEVMAVHVHVIHDAKGQTNSIEYVVKTSKGYISVPEYAVM